MIDWQVSLSRLADELTGTGKLTSPRWQAAFRSVPRHVFVPEYYRQDKTGDWVRVAVDNPQAVDAVYANVALATDVDERGAGVSSSSEPGLMTRMLELLDVERGHRVLEIGTGTGYNTALLCAALGDDQVFSIDVDYTDAARERLATLGYQPTLRTGDGIGGIPDHGPFDRVISTVAVRRIPQAWVDQLADGGIILADVKVNVSAGNLAVLRKHGSTVQGRFDTGRASFMPMRHPDRPEQPEADRHPGHPTLGSTERPPVAWEHPLPWFLACLEVGGGVDVGYVLGGDYQPVAATLAAPDGSWAEVDMTGGGVRQAGPTRLWDAVERAFEVWESADRPGWARLGLTVTSDAQSVWLDQPANIVGKL